MPISPELLEILCCPKTKVPVQILPADQLARLNDAIAKGTVTNAGGEKVEKPLQEGLITEDGETIYRIDDDIPVMLVDEGITAAQLGAG